MARERIESYTGGSLRTEGVAHSGGKGLVTSPSVQLELLLRCWRWPKPGAPGGRGRCTDGWVPLPGNSCRCIKTGMLSTAVQTSWSPESLGEPSEGERMVS